MNGVGGLELDDPVKDQRGRHVVVRLPAAFIGRHNGVVGSDDDG